MCCRCCTLDSSTRRSFSPHPWRVFSRPLNKFYFTFILNIRHYVGNLYGCNNARCCREDWLNAPGDGRHGTSHETALSTVAIYATVYQHWQRCWYVARLIGINIVHSQGIRSVHWNEWAVHMHSGVSRSHNTTHADSTRGARRADQESHKATA